MEYRNGRHFLKIDLIDEFITGNKIRKYLEKGSEYLEHF